MRNKFACKIISKKSCGRFEKNISKKTLRQVCQKMSKKQVVTGLPKNI
jgi:hypothetical protein